MDVNEQPKERQNWRRVYLAVLLFLVLEIVVFILISSLY